MLWGRGVKIDETFLWLRLMGETVLELLTGDICFCARQCVCVCVCVRARARARRKLDNPDRWDTVTFLGELLNTSVLWLKGWDFFYLNLDISGSGEGHFPVPTSPGGTAEADSFFYNFHEMGGTPFFPTSTSGLVPLVFQDGTDSYC